MWISHIKADPGDRALYLASHSLGSGVRVPLTVWILFHVPLCYNFFVDVTSWKGLIVLNPIPKGPTLKDPMHEKNGVTTTNDSRPMSENMASVHGIVGREMRRSLGSTCSFIASVRHNLGQGLMTFLIICRDFTSLVCKSVPSWASGAEAY